MKFGKEERKINEETNKRNTYGKWIQIHITYEHLWITSDIIFFGFCARYIDDNTSMLIILIEVRVHFFVLFREYFIFDFFFFSVMNIVGSSFKWLNK